MSNTDGEIVALRKVNSGLADGNHTLLAENAALRKQIVHEYVRREVYEAGQKDNDRLVDEYAELREALAKYGEHQDCRAISTTTCQCGYLQALAQGEK